MPRARRAASMCPVGFGSARGGATLSRIKPPACDTGHSSLIGRSIGDHRHDLLAGDAPGGDGTCHRFAYPGWRKRRCGLVQRALRQVPCPGRRVGQGSQGDRRISAAQGFSPADLRPCAPTPAADRATNTVQWRPRDRFRAAADAACSASSFPQFVATAIARPQSPMSVNVG
jgi:hypothetical protein